MSSSVAIPTVPQIQRELARRHILDFAEFILPGFEDTVFHRTYYAVLEAFATGRIRRLIVSLPPQHGKSLGSSEMLPAWLLGRDPDLRVAIASYSFGLARKFSQRIQRHMTSAEYAAVFPGSKLKSNSPAAEVNGYQQTTEEFDIVGHEGSLKAVGRGGSLTGNRVDCFILDDLYKDAAEANSPVIRDAVVEWYSTVVRTRMHNDSRELIVFTRWHEDDLIGYIEKTNKVVNLQSLDQLDDIPRGAYVKVNFPALKEGPATPIDPRPEGVALWPSRHSEEKLLEERRRDPLAFAALYQGDPRSKEGLLYGDFATYDDFPADATLVHVGNYTDTSDTGDDNLCSINYRVYKEAGDALAIYITDVAYTTEPMEITEGIVADMLIHDGVRVATIESNNGGRGFARAVQSKAPKVRVDWFHQSANKEARILTNAATVTRFVRMPAGWTTRWPRFAADIKTFKRLFRANRHDDAPDALTGVVEREILTTKARGIRFAGY